MSEIGIITNPHSKLNRRNPALISRLRDAMPANCRLFVSQNLLELADLANQFSKQNIQILLICGGDGTISQILTAMINAYNNQPLPLFGILPGGTMNLVSHQIGQGGSALSAVRKLQHRSIQELERASRPLQTICVGNHYGFLYADGSNVNILQEFYKRKSGVIGASVLAGKLIGSFLVKTPMIKRLIENRPIDLSYEQKTSMHLHSLGNFAGTISRLPLRLPFLPFARENHNKFQFVIVTCRKEKLLWHLPFIMLQQKKGLSLGKFTDCSSRLTIRASQPFPYTIDGEVFKSNESAVTIHCGPVVRFITL